MGGNVNVSTNYVNGTRRCSNCTDWLPWASFNKNASNTSGLQGNCRTCNTANFRDRGARRAAMETWERHVEVWEWNKARDRGGMQPCRKGGGSCPLQAFSLDSHRPSGVQQSCAIHSLSSNRKLYESIDRHADPTCSGCDRQMSEIVWAGEKIHVDHLVPLARGGKDVAENLALKCARCNMVKGKRTEEEFAVLTEEHDQLIRLLAERADRGTRSDVWYNGVMTFTDRLIGWLTCSNRAVIRDNALRAARWEDEAASRRPRDDNKDKEQGQ